MPAKDDNQPKADDRYVVVARRYRPKSFGELVGQQHVGQALCNAIETNRVGHAYLFTGARGVGKTSTARIFAKALNDPDGPTCSPDGASDTAQAIDAGEDVDVLEIDGASNRGIDEIRSLRANVGVRPSRSRYKIYIIDEVHMLTSAAFNALLKTLEEPPSHVKFIFCTTDPEKIPITVLSRCQRFDFSPVKSEEIMGRLREIVSAEHVEADDDALRLISRRADGSMRDSQSLLEQVISFSTGPITAETVHMMLGTADDTRLHAMAQVLASGDAKEALRLVDQAAIEGIAAGQFTEQLLGYFRDLIAVTVGCPAEMQRHTSEVLHHELKTLGQSWGIQRLLAIIGMIDQTLVRIRHTVHGRVLLEATLIQICHLPDFQSIVDIAASLTAGVSGTGAAVRPKAPPSAPTVAIEKKNIEPTTRASDSTPVQANATNSMVRSDVGTPLPTKLNHHLAASQEVVTAATKPIPSPALALASSPTFAVARKADLPSLGTDGDARADNEPSPDGPFKTSVSGAARFQPTTESKVGPPVLAKTRIQRVRDMEAYPYVKTCIEMFDGEIIRIDNAST